MFRQMDLHGVLRMLQAVTFLVLYSGSSMSMYQILGSAEMFTNYVFSLDIAVDVYPHVRTSITGDQI